MKKKTIFRKKCLIFIPVLFIIFISFVRAGNIPVIPSKNINDFKDELKLSEPQIKKFEKTIKIYYSQAILDRETFKTNSIALIEAAKRRRSIFDAGMNSFLNDEQKMQYESIKRDSIIDKELFILKEGLLLTDPQVLQARFILEEYNPRIDIIRENMSEMHGNRDPDRSSTKGSISGGRGSSIRGGRGGMKRGSSLNGGPGGEIAALKKAKSKKIKAILIELQKKLYKQLNKYLSKKTPKGRHSI